MNRLRTSSYNIRTRVMLKMVGVKIFQQKKIIYEENHHFLPYVRDI